MIVKKLVLLSMVLSVAACSNGSNGGSSVLPEDNNQQSQPHPVVNPTQDDDPVSEAPTEMPTIGVPSGAQSLGSDVVDNWIDIPHGWHISEVVVTAGKIAFEATEPGYEDQVYVATGHITFDEAIDSVSNDSIRRTGCTQDYGVARLYLNTGGPERNENFLEVMCEGRRYKTPQFDFHYVSLAGQFSVHGYLAPNSASAFISMNMSNLPGSGTVCVEITSVDAHGEFLGLQPNECFADIIGQNHLNEMYRLPLYVFSGEYILVWAYVCPVGNFDLEGNCMKHSRQGLDQIAQLIELKY